MRYEADWQWGNAGESRNGKAGAGDLPVRPDNHLTHPSGAVGARSPARRAPRAQRGMAIPLVSQSELVLSEIDAWRSSITTTT